MMKPQKHRPLRFLPALLLACIAVLPARAQEPAKSPEPAKTPGEMPPIEKISDGVMKIGEVTLDKNRMTVSFPGSVNMDHGEVEYLLVQEGGKTHESLLATKALPFHVHVAMLLLGAKIPPQADVQPPPSAISAAYLKNAPKPKGPDVMIFVRWVEDGKTVAVHAEDLINDDATKNPMSRGPWVYNGSMVNRGVFLAQADRSIAALVIDPSALVNNERPDSNNDKVWSVAKEKIPKAGTAVEISIQLQADDAKPDSKASPPSEPK